jgi:hypothetical protein
MTQKTILPVTATHGVSPPPPNHIYWPVVRSADGYEVERCADYATAVARAKVHAQLAVTLNLPK